MDLESRKRSVRVAVRDALARLPPARRALEEEVVQAAIQSDPAWQQARRVLLYQAVPPEFSVVGLTLAAWRQGKVTAFPRVAGPGGLTLHAVSSWQELSPGAFGIPEPRAEAPSTDPGEVDLAIIPGVAWGPDGARLGRGGGYYDRLLPRLRGPSWGVGFDSQWVEELPVASHDARVARVVTMARIPTSD